MLLFSDEIEPLNMNEKGGRVFMKISYYLEPLYSSLEDSYNALHSPLAPALIKI